MCVKFELLTSQAANARTTTTHRYELAGIGWTSQGVAVGGDHITLNWLRVDASFAKTISKS
jgi:hypothetical protein